MVLTLMFDHTVGVGLMRFDLKLEALVDCMHVCVQVWGGYVSLHRTGSFNPLQNWESAPWWFSFHLSDNIHSSCSLFYFSSFPRFFPPFYALPLFYTRTHICAGNDGVIFCSADRKSDEEDQGDVQHLRVVNSNPVSQTHTHRDAHTHKYRLILTLWQLIPLRQSTKLKFSSAYKLYSGYYQLNFYNTQNGGEH